MITDFVCCVPSSRPAGGDKHLFLSRKFFRKKFGARDKLEPGAVVFESLFEAFKRPGKRGIGSAWVDVSALANTLVSTRC